MKELPKEFEEFSEARRNSFIKVKELKEQGENIVGIFCTFTPVEIIRAAGATAVSLCGTSSEPIIDAEAHLPKNLCPLIKSSYGFALTQKCPNSYFSDLIIGETTCDGKKKMFEYLAELKPVHIMQLPQTVHRDHAYSVWRNELIFLKERLEKEFNVQITEEKIKEEIKKRNEERRVLQEFYSLGKLCPPPVTGYEMKQVLLGSEFTLDKEDQNKKIRNIMDKLKKEYEQGVRKVSGNAPRILVTGCPLGGTIEKTVKTIEDSGAVVVCFENCAGVREKARLVDETIDPYDALTDKYLNVGCSVMSPNTNRMEMLEELIDEYKIDGVIEIILQACHTFNVESHRVKKVVANEKKVPYMRIETDYSQTDTGQIRTRIEAFVEML